MGMKAGMETTGKVEIRRHPLEIEGMGYRNIEVLAVEAYGKAAVPALYDETKKAVKEEFPPIKGHGGLRLAKEKKRSVTFGNCRMIGSGRWICRFFMWRMWNDRVIEIAVSATSGIAG